MSFADELNEQKPKDKVIHYPIEIYVDSIITAIKYFCKINKSQKINKLKGYACKRYGWSQFMPEPNCYFQKMLFDKKIIAGVWKDKSYNGELYYPGSYKEWDGLLFNINDKDIIKIKEAFDKLGFKDSTITFTKVEVEKAKKSLLKTTFKKTGIFGYLIYVDIKW